MFQLRNTIETWILKLSKKWLVYPYCAFFRAAFMDPQKIKNSSAEMEKRPG